MFDSLLGKEKYYKKRTFTFYIPSPPSRRSGYQEKEFDSVIEYITSLGFDLIDFKMEAHSNETSSGMWVICILGAKTKKIYDQKIDIDTAQLGHNTKTDSIPLDPSIVHDV